MLLRMSRIIRIPPSDSSVHRNIDFLRAAAHEVQNGSQGPWTVYLVLNADQIVPSHRQLQSLAESIADGLHILLGHHDFFIVVFSLFLHAFSLLSSPRFFSECGMVELHHLGSEGVVCRGAAARPDTVVYSAYVPVCSRLSGLLCTGNRSPVGLFPAVREVFCRIPCLRSFPPSYRSP